ncbi:hypothetical protein QN277_013353 [Acacia crassicarpa]|uniref:Rho termination factor N-terminal domain-containing protein n=1 Tax=Acacia crassicarpa TaxID=499986 RepID=A0AAE1N3E6_9FABA|nr:hypothetical protein QN277_013353 [Acacia crassicarpa]
MAWDLWSSTYDEAVLNSDNCESLGRQFDTYFNCEHDIMEEDALNEKSCIQVLKKLIIKEDAEIEELEKDLLSLQNEHQNWPEICCNALTEKINWLEVSIRSLKNDRADNDRIQLLLHNGPAGTLDEILKAALADSCQDNCRQGGLAKTVPRSAALGAISSVIGPSDGMNLLGTSDLKVLVNDEGRRSQLVTADEGQILNSFSSKGKENVLKEVKQERETVKNVTTNERLDSNLGASRQVKRENSNFEPKLCDFAPKTDKGKSQVRDLNSEPTVNLWPSIVSEPSKLTNQRKRKLGSDAFSTGGPGEDPVELISNTSSKVTHKRPRKSRTSNDGANLVYSLSGEVYERTTIRPEQHEFEYAIVPYDSKFSELQKKRNACKLPVTAGIQNSLVAVDLSKLNPVAMDNGNHEVESQNKTSALVPVNLKNLTLINLRAIAKQYNVKKYYRMAKAPLLEQLTQIIGDW